MQWLLPSLIASFAGILILTLAYAYLYYRERHLSMAIWTGAWACYALRLVFMGIHIHYPHAAWLILNQSCSLLNGLLLLGGLHHWVGKPFSRLWLILTGACELWIIFSISADLPFTAISVPTFSLLGLITMAAGLVFLKNRDIEEVGKWFVGLTFLLWGLHKFNYPFLRPVEWFAPWGYLLAAFFSLCAALGILLVYLDRHRSELARSRQMLSSIYNGADTVSLITTDMQGEHSHVVTFSPGAEKMFGYRADEIIGREVAILHLPEDVKKFPQMEQEVREKHTSFSGEVTLVRKNGEHFPAFFSVRPVLDEKGQVTAALGVTVDISELKQAQRQRDELIEELRQKNTQLEQFVYTVSHDLKSPLVTINGFVGLLSQDLEQNRSDRVSEDLATIKTAVEHMHSLLMNLLELSRSGRGLDQVAPVDMNRICREAMNALAAQLRESGLTVRIAGNLPTVQGDHQRLLQVVQNFIDNAIKYRASAADPRVEIGCEPHDDHLVRFFVRDNGAGIEPQYLQRIFKLFEQLKPSAPGTGVGLALVKQIIELHGGTVWAESPGAGRGSTFYFTLPRAETTGSPSA